MHPLNLGSLIRKYRGVLAISIMALALAAVSFILYQFLSFVNAARDLQQDLLFFQEDGGGLSISQSQAEFNDILARTQKAKQQVDRLEQHTAPMKAAGALLGWLPRVGPSLRAIPDMVALADHLLNGVELSLKSARSLTPGIKAMLGGEMPPERPETMESVQAATREMEQARQYRDRINATTLLPQIRQSLQQADRAMASLESFLALASISPELLGLNGPRRYLLLAQNADELRPTGGYVAGLWLLTFDGGVLQDMRYYDTVNVDDQNRLYLYPTPPDGLFAYMNARVWLLRDVSWEPDFPSTAQMAEDMFWLGQSIRVDGVIGLNQWALLPAVQALGTIPLGDGTSIDADSFIPALERGKDLKGRAFMDTVVRGILDSFRQGISLSRFLAVNQAAYRSLKARDLLMYFNDQQAQEAVHAQGWDGALANLPGDYLGVFDANVGWNKVNRNIEREVNYEVLLSESGAPQAQVSIIYRNRSKALHEGCVQYVSQGPYEEEKNGCYWNYFRIYAPGGSVMVGAPVLPLPQGAARGKPPAPVDTVFSTENYGKSIFGGLVVVPPLEERSISFSYRLPQAVVSKTSDSIGYSLLIQKQPGISDVSARIRIHYPFSFHIATASSSSGFINVLSDEIEFDLKSGADQRIVLQLERGR